MLDKVINNHIDRMDKIESDIDSDIEAILKTIDVKAIIADAGKELTEIIEIIKKRVMEEHIPSAIEEGTRFAKEAEKDGEIEISRSKNPTANGGLADDEGRG